MKEYLMNIAGAIIITVFAEVMLPDKWSKYVKIITGLIIISAIASPVKDKINFDIKAFFDEGEQYVKTGEEYSAGLIKTELEKRINEDCAYRIMEEYKKDITVTTKVEINDKNEITGVLLMEIEGDELGSDALGRIYEIYAPKEVIVNGNKKSE